MLKWMNTFPHSVYKASSPRAIGHIAYRDFNFTNDHRMTIPLSTIIQNSDKIIYINFSHRKTVLNF